MVINPCLTFPGNCRKAFEFYQSVFGGDFSFISTFGQAPVDLEIAEADRDRIIHVSLPIGSNVLMGSDALSTVCPDLTAGNNFSVSIHPTSRAETEQIFEKLSEGGTVIVALADAHWGSYYTMFSDRFGITWQINHDPVAE